MTLFQTEYIGAGANKSTSAADWSSSGQIAYGADQNVALWTPSDDRSRGVSALLRGHTAKVCAVRFFAGTLPDTGRVLLTGSGDGELRVWRLNKSAPDNWRCIASAKAHTGTVNAIATTESSTSIFATAGADATVKLWRLRAEGVVSLVHTIALQPRYIALTIILGSFGPDTATKSLFLVAGGTRTSIQVYAISRLDGHPEHTLQATLAGHEGWIQSLAITAEGVGAQDADLLLASASQDKYVRLWRFHRNDDDVASEPKLLDQTNGVATFEQTLTSKIQTVEVADAWYSITCEALLLGHEDWVYTASWNPQAGSVQLLTASADNSLTIWEPDPASGIWISTTRLGEISGQKGATSATGSTGGFWIGLWSPDGRMVTSLAKTGSWRLWILDERQLFWTPRAGVSGHLGPVNDIAWARVDHQNSYLLSTGSDQTTRLHARWRRGGKESWHEFARPQIHGYDLNCIASIDPKQFVSGADEKLLRVFGEPRAVATILQRLSGLDSAAPDSLPEGASMPVLGLSNKAIERNEGGDPEGDELRRHADNLLETDQVPTEDMLARHTLWPEHEKLYGHGYEISAVAYEPQSRTLATACKASSVEHAVIRLYDAGDWHEVKPPLAVHTLTVTRLACFNSAQPYLLSVGRDRQWALFKRAEEEGTQRWILHQSNAKAHLRMILDAAWSPMSLRPFFATAGRDKTIKLWAPRPTTAEQSAEADGDFICVSTIARQHPVTAVSFASNRKHEDLAGMAVGEEDGQISLHVIDMNCQTLRCIRSFELEIELCPSRSISRLAWAPGRQSLLAIASVDASVRIMNVPWENEKYEREDLV